MTPLHPKMNTCIQGIYCKTDNYEGASRHTTEDVPLLSVQGWASAK
jgi:hypothetical protein